MTAFFFCLGLIQCALLWFMGRAGQIQLARIPQERERADKANAPWPRCALIIPVAGKSPLIETALRSLLLQDYPDFHVYMVTATSAEPASGIIEKLIGDYPNLTHIVAGEAVSCGQKNHNLLAAVANCGNNATVFAFCDSTHMAEPDFLRCLLLPQAVGKGEFSVGYHEVMPQDKGLITLAYALNVLFMRFLQGVPGLTQPWGGAMAITREAFSRLRIADLWATNVVDDCSLGAYLAKEGIRPVYCPAALLRTMAARHPRQVWQAWLERQILFLKFCFPGQWLGLCAFSCVMLFPFIWGAWAILEGLFDFGTMSAPFLALCWFFLFMGEMGVWRKFLPVNIPSWLCMCAFFLSSGMLFVVALRTFFTRTLYWHNIQYQVGKNGRVLSLKKDG